MKKLGVLTIGQSPRTDVTPTFRTILGDTAEIIERGALDTLTENEINDIAPTENDVTYISRLRNGKAVKINKQKLLPLLQQQLDELEKETDLVIMLCTGDFPTITSTKPIIYPDKLLVKVLEAILAEGKLGLIIPLIEQKKSLLEKWSGINIPIVVEVASPYGGGDFHTAANKLQQQGATAVVLDCMGYNEEHKEEVSSVAGLPTILSRSLIASIAKEYL